MPQNTKRDGVDSKKRCSAWMQPAEPPRPTTGSGWYKAVETASSMRAGGARPALPCARTKGSKQYRADPARESNVWLSGGSLAGGASSARQSDTIEANARLHNSGATTSVCPISCESGAFPREIAHCFGTLAASVVVSDAYSPSIAIGVRAHPSPTRAFVLDHSELAA